jgi:hypothetical protein
LYLPRSSCSAGDDPAAFARALEQNARAKLERAAFVPGDAVRALGLISEAALCHAAAGDAAAAEAARDELQHRAQQLEADYRERRARLALALADGRVSDARSESHGLLQLLADHDDDYTRWLRHIERGAP